MPGSVPRQFDARVVGVTYQPGYPANLERLAYRIFHAEVVDGHRERIMAVLVRQPDNPVDANAVAVHVEGQPVGHLPRSLAERMAPYLDSGARYEAEVAWVHSGAHPTIEIHVRRIEVAA